jgi:hypothetical protein
MRKLNRTRKIHKHGLKPLAVETDEAKKDMAARWLRNHKRTDKKRGK